MKSSITLLAMAILTQSCVSSAKAQTFTSLEGQEWVFDCEIVAGNKAGLIWKFFADNRFEYKIWYSGGAYSTRKYEGSYKYDDNEKKVFLSFDSNQNLKVDQLTPKMAVRLNISKKDTIPIITKSWDKDAEEYPKIGDKSESVKSLFANQKFSIRKMATKNSSKK